MADATRNGSKPTHGRGRQVRKVLLLAGVALLSAYFMADAYRRAQSDAIQQLYAQERILATQAAKGISAYFDNYRHTLQFFCEDPDVIRNNERGRRLLKAWFQSEAGRLLSVTRVGTDARIIYTYPEERSIGQDISNQAHIKTIFATHRPVVSEVFRSVQGFQCVALHMPVFENGRFAGTLAALFPFESISREHVEGVRIGESGYAILLSREGVELFCAVPGHVRQSIYETSKDFPSVIAMADRMLRGETGIATYDYDAIRGRVVPGVHKHAYFMPIPLDNTFWSICVNAPEEEALLFITGFRNRWILGVTLLLVAFGVWGVFLARAYLTIDRERAQREAEASARQAEREREKMLAESEARFRTYFEDSLVAMGICSPQKQWLAVNERFTRLLGFSREELHAMNWMQLTDPNDLDVLLKEYDRMLAGGMEGFSIEKRFLRKDKEIVHAILSMRLVRTAEGAPAFCLVQLQDVTDRKRLEAQLLQAQKIEAIGQLAGGVAHDFNNILAAIMMRLQLLQMNPGLDHDTRLGLQDLNSEAQRAGALTRQLLMFSRRSVLAVKPLDLNEVVANLLKMLTRLIGEHFNLRFDGKTALPLVEADAGMMEQVLMNLVVNSRDAMPDGGRITISTAQVDFTAAEAAMNPDRRPGRFVCLAVSDDGCGMGREIIDHIFDPFFTTKEAGKGTGLGLATVHGITAQHKGWVEVESEVGRGTTFRVLLPALPDAPTHVPQTAQPEVLRGGRETILLVEDDESVRGTLGQSLRALGYTVYEARNGQEAMALWQAAGERIELLFTDMVMPEGMTGLELTERLRALKPGLKTVISSGYSAEIVQTGMPTKEGIVYLPKPYATSQLADVVRKCLDRKI